VSADLDQIFAMHAASSWGPYGTFAGEPANVWRDRFRIPAVERPASIRRFACDPVPRAWVCEVLSNVYALDLEGRSPTPSAGNLHSVQLHLADGSTGELFGVRGRKLARIGRIEPKRLLRMVYEQVEGAVWLVLLSADIGPMALKYGARAWRFALLEAGHLAQALCQRATSLELGCCPIGGFDDRTFEELVVSGTHVELPLYIIALGARPKDTTSKEAKELVLRIPAYEIETPRLLLRPWQPGDAPALAAALGEGLDHLQPWLPWARDEPLDLAEREALLRRFRGNFDLDRDYFYGLFDRTRALVRGGVGLHPLADGVHAIGYWLAASAVGHGLASEAAAALARVGFELLELRRLEIRCEVGNPRSAAVPARLGFIHEGILRGRARGPEGELRDLEIWGMLAVDYSKSSARKVKITARDALGRVRRLE
jgi:SagB-type dehydrogenase family enzyme